MSWSPSRASRAGRIRFRAGAGAWRWRGGASLLLVIGLLLVSGACGQNVQTTRPYTPGEGINVDVGDPAIPNKVVHVRNLAIISFAPGEGILSGSIVTADRDALTAVSGTPLKVDGTEGAPFTATIPNTVSVANNALVVLTDQAPITLEEPGSGTWSRRDRDAGVPERRRGDLASAGRRRQRGSVRCRSSPRQRPAPEVGRAQPSNL